MPFKSEKQRRYLHAKHPEIADRWEKKYGKPTRRKSGGRRVPSKRGKS